ncbi:MAG: TIGR01440 family protein [Oscillospiraceae bacterium]|jgi:uncharacterized protein (TIGR01440 family)|nr:TIGR01440 family protein [Oscillospiraceae bacterium]
MYEELTEQARSAAGGLLEAARLEKGSLMVVGCSSSEVLGKRIGSGSSLEAARAILAGILPLLEERGIFLAAQCCEHLNRALILEKAAAARFRLEQVNAVPQPKAGGSFASAAYQAFRAPCAVERIQAGAGMDIGDTLIGMHLAPTAVPVRLEIRRIGEANLVCARTRPRFIGGERAVYDARLL